MHDRARRPGGKSLNPLSHSASALVLAGLSVFASGAPAQDLFEIQVYPYETVEPRHTMVELHMNFIPSGTTRTENGVFPNHHQFHFTVEITQGLTHYFEFAGYLVTAWGPDVGPEFAGGSLPPQE